VCYACLVVPAGKDAASPEQQEAALEGLLNMTCCIATAAQSYSLCWHYVVVGKDAASPEQQEAALNRVWA
jgi:hypothetical protein